MAAGKAALHALGTGDGWAGDGQRGHSAFLFRLGGKTLLVDCGEPVSRRLHSAGVKPDDIDGILISHLHCDHVGGFFMLMQGLWLDQRTRELPIYMPAEGLEPVRNMLRASYIFDELLAFSPSFKVLEEREPINVHGVKVTPYLTTHLDQLKKSFSDRYPAKFEAFNFIMETDIARVAHSADIGSVHDLSPLLTHPVDLLVCELAHVEPIELFNFLCTHKIGHIAFTHLSRPFRSNLKELKTQATESLEGIPHTFLNDGDLIEV